MNERAELERLRKLKRLRELEVKAAGRSVASPVEATPKPQQGALQTGLEKAADTLTLGYLPQLQAYADKFMTEQINDAAGVRPDFGKLDYVQSRDQNIKRLAQAEKDNPTASTLGTIAGGVASGLIPGGIASKALKGASAMGRVGAAAAQGALTGAVANPGDIEGQISGLQVEDRATNALTGGAIGSVLGGAGELAKKVINSGNSIARRAARMTPEQAKAYTKNSKAVHDMADMIDDPMRASQLQDQAADAIQQSRKSLRAEGLKKASQLEQLIRGKEVDVDARSLLGKSPEIDKMLSSKAGVYGDIPGEIKLSGTDANRAKRILQQQAEYRPGVLLDPVQDAKLKDAAGLASKLRGKIETVGGPEVKALNDQMQEGMLLQKSLRQALKKPLAAVSTESPDARAVLSRAAKADGGGLLEFGSKYGAAKTIASKDVDDALSRALQKSAGRATLRGLARTDKAVSKVKDPKSLQAILNMVFSESKDNKENNE